ncbi:MAG: NACHT domain-containing protein [Burkholderiales bacterium]|nr:NACHT domain-containing protein [Burkholderiales bacterium]
MVELIALTSAWQAAQPFIKPVVDKFYTPRIDVLAKKLEKEQALTNDKFRKIIDDYAYSVYKSSETISTLIFSNQQVQTKEIFYPIKLEYQDPATKESCNASMHEFMDNLIPQFTNILISDTAGMGKSTMVKWLALNQIENGVIIPLVIELKKIDKSHSLIDEIMTLINPLDKELNNDAILELLQHGKFCIIFDGYDEIRSEHKETVTADILTLVNKASENQFILTSRPEESLSSFGSFKSFHIIPLKLDESFTMFKTFDKISGLCISETLIGDVQLNPQVHEFLINPFLVSLLYKSYTYNKDIPLCKSTFYSDVFSALFKGHDLSKGSYRREKKSNLGFEDFKIILRQLAFDSFQKNIVSYSYDELIGLINQIKKKYLHLSFSPDDFCDDLTQAVPLFIKDGNTLRWSHKSFLDYFTADFIVTSDKQVEILEAIYNSKVTRAMNILGFVYELNQSLFRKTIISKFFKDYITENNLSFKETTTVNQADLAVRKHLLVNFEVNLAIFTEAYLLSKLTEKTHDNYDKLSRVAFDEYRLLKEYSSATCHNVGGIYLVISENCKSYFNEVISSFIELKDRTFYEQYSLPDLKEVMLELNSSSLKVLETNKLYNFNNDSDSNPLNSSVILRQLNNVLYYSLGRSRCIYDIPKVRQIIQEIEQESRASEIDFNF